MPPRSKHWMSCARLRSTRWSSPSEVTDYYHADNPEVDVQRQRSLRRWRLPERRASRSSFTAAPANWQHRRPRLAMAQPMRRRICCG